MPDGFLFWAEAPAPQTSMVNVAMYSLFIGFEGLMNRCESDDLFALHHCFTPSFFALFSAS